MLSITKLYKMDKILDNIREHRILKKFTQTDLADKIGITQQTYQLIEKGKLPITLDRLQKIAEVLDVDILVFFGADNRDSEEIRKENEFLRGHNDELVKSLKDKRLRLSKIYYGLKVLEEFLEVEGLSEEEFRQALDRYASMKNEKPVDVRKQYKYIYKLNALEFLQMLIQDINTADFKEFD